MTTSSSEPNLPDFSDALAKIALLTRRPSTDSLVDLSAYPFLLAPSVHAYGKDKTKPMYLRRMVAEKLVVAQSFLPEGFCFKILSGWRSLAEQSALFEAYKSSLSEEFPELGNAELHRRAAAFIAPPDHEVLIPPHCTGGAVDLTIADSQGRSVDMGECPDDGGLKYFNAECSAFFFEQAGGNPIAAENRRLLRSVMTLMDFCICEEEWWDFNYGNDVWAVSTGRSYSFYGYIEP
jgi:D-alanyl-D-alanine dipeptidase